MDQRDATVGGTEGPLRYFKLNIGGAEHGLRQVIGKVGFVKAFSNSLLACATAIRHNSIHSKSLREKVCHSLSTNETPQNAEGFRVFFDTCKIANKGMLV